MTNHLKIDLVHSQIIVTRKFAIQAAKTNTPEFEFLAEVRKRHPDCTVVQRTITKKIGKRTYEGYTYKAMREHLVAWYGKTSQEVKEYDGFRKYAESQNWQPFPYVKKKFLEKYGSTIDFGRATK